MTRQLFLILNKDMSVSRTGSGLMLIVFLALIFPSVLIEGSLLIPMIFIPFFLSINGLQIDDAHGGERLLCSLPVARSTIVWTRYLSSLAYTILCFALALFTGWVITVIFPHVQFHWTEQLTWPRIHAWLVPLSLILSCFFPAYFKWGYVKGFLIAGISTAVISALTAGIFFIMASHLGGPGNPDIPVPKSGRTGIVNLFLHNMGRFVDRMGLSGFLTLITVLMVLLLISSILVSLRVFKNRDL